MDGSPFVIRGANCYYLGFASDAMVEDVFDLAFEMDLNALRLWAFYDRGVDSEHQICFQFQNRDTREICFNDGPTGLERLDRTIALAETRNLRIILPLVNNWDDFGGMNQYLQWFGIADKSKFFVDSRVKRAYRNYAEHLLLRTNTRTGRQYRDDPTILAWELANEPRCETPDGTEFLSEWVAEMSHFLKTLDSNHPVGVGDEGFFRRARAGNNRLYNGAYGVDCERLLGIPDIDFGTCHLYPSYLEQENSNADPIAFGRRWIREHIEAAERAGKPMIVEEFGWRSDDRRSTREEAFSAWLDEVQSNQGAGALVWMIAGKDDAGELYPDYDQYTVYAPPNKKRL